MEQSPHARDMSTLVGTAKTLERAISGLQMTTERLLKMLREDVDSPSTRIATLIQTLQSLNDDEKAIVDNVLCGRCKPKRKPR